MQVVATSASGRLNVGAETGTGTREVGNGLFHKGRLDQPRHRVPPLDPVRSPRGATAGEQDLPASLVQLLGYLAARLAASHDEDLAGWEDLGVRVRLRVDNVE